MSVIKAHRIAARLIHVNVLIQWHSICKRLDTRAADPTPRFCEEEDGTVRSPENGARRAMPALAALHRDSALTCVNRAAAALRSLKRRGDGTAGARIRAAGCSAATDPLSAFTSPVRAAHDIHPGR